MRLVLWTVWILFLVQIFLALALAVHLSRDPVEFGVRVLAQPHPAPGLSAGVRVQVYSRYHGRSVQGVEVDARLRDSGRAVELTPADAGGSVREGRLQEHSGDALVLAVRGPGFEEREFEVAFGEGTLRDWPAGLRPWVRPAARGEAALDSRQPPGLRWLGAGPQDAEARRNVAGCPFEVVATATGGVPSRFVSNEIWFRFANADGSPVAGLEVVIEGDGEGRLPEFPARVSDRGGLVALRVAPVQTERLTLRHECLGEPVERVLEVVPSWDGAAWRQGHALWPEDARPRFELEQQRAGGRWSAHLFCDGQWTLVEASGVREGDSLFEVSPPGMGAARGWHLCRLVHAAQSWRMEGPGVWFVVHEAGRDGWEVVEEVARSWRPHAPSTLQPHVSEDALAALRSSDEETRRRYGIWLMSALPEIRHTLPVALDDLESLLEADRTRRAEAGARVRLLLAVDAVVLVVGLLWLLLVGSLRRRRAFLEVALEEADEDEQSEKLRRLERREQWRGLLAGTFGVGLIVAFIIAMATLLHYVT